MLGIYRTISGGILEWCSREKRFSILTVTPLPFPPAPGCDSLGAVFTVSPSQIQTYLKCGRQWAYSKLAALPRVGPEPAYFKYGRDLHLALERYLLGHGVDWASLEPDHAAFMRTVTDPANVGKLLPAPGTWGLKVECTYARTCPVPGVIIQGRMDYVLHDIERPRILIGDHKSTSGKRYGPLAEDVQANVLAWLAYQLDPADQLRQVECRWSEFHKKSPGRVTLHRQADELLPRGRVEQFMGDVVWPAVRDMTRHRLAMYPDLEGQFPAEPQTSCFGKRALCDHWDRCTTRDKAMTVQANPELDGMDDWF